MQNTELLPALSCTLPVLEINFQELKDRITEITETYSGLIVQEADVPAIKNEMAGLNKLAVQLADARKDAVLRVSAPIREFEGKIKSLEANIISTRSLLDEQVKAHIERERTCRRASVQLIIDVHKKEHGCKDLEIPIQESWLNKTAKDKDTSNAILAIIFEHKRQVEEAAKLEQAKKDRIIALENHNAALAQSRDYALSFSHFAHLQSLDIQLSEALKVLSDAYKAEDARLAEVDKVKNTPSAAEPETYFADLPQNKPAEAVKIEVKQKTMTITATYSEDKANEIRVLYQQLKNLCQTCTVSVREVTNVK